MNDINLFFHPNQKLSFIENGMESEADGSKLSEGVAIAIDQERGSLEAILPSEIVLLIRDYLSFKELKQFQGTIKSLALRTTLYNRDYFIRSCVLPEALFGENEWIKKKIQPIPQEMQEILDGPEGAFYAPIFMARYFLTKGGQIVPASFRRIIEVAKNKNSSNPGPKYLSESVQALQRAPKKENMCWMLVTKSVISKSRNQGWEEQEKIFSDWTKEKKERQGFEIIKVETLVYTLLWHYEATGERIYSHYPLTYGRCSVGEELVEVGSFGPSGFIADTHLDDFDDAYHYIGVGGERKFIETIGSWKLNS